jgi:type II secretory ATPase GspE/PulE/Tfp pilus assembly ATPase PilB-like protein
MSDYPWQRLKRREISTSQALGELVNDSRSVNLDLLDPQLQSQFFNQVVNLADLPPVMPLLLWQCKYYLGSPKPLSATEIDRLRDYTSADIEVVSIAKRSYRDWLRLQNINVGVISNESIDTSFDLDDDLEPENIGEIAEVELAKAPDQVSRINVIISNALRSRASDIHLEPDVDGLRVRYRVDGVMRDVTILPPEVSRKVIVSCKVMCDMDIAESRRPQDGRIGKSYVSDNSLESRLDMRVSTLPCIGGEKIVIRLLPQDNPFKSIEDLGFTPKTLTTYQKWLEEPQGMVILTGPTGSGKTSTLYTSLQKIATEQVNVVTVEDPVEYVLPKITQTQVHETAGMTFAAGLRAILRQDPDIIMVGEIRDPETAETAVRAALTGHLVLTTLHTNDAASALPRLRDIGPDPGLICDALLGVVAQRLVRKVCPHCAQPHVPAEAELNLLGLNLQTANPTAWRKGKGCAKCFYTGYYGREAIIELLEVDRPVKQIIYEGSMPKLNTYLNSIGFNSFRVSAIAKVTQGITTVEELRRVLPYSALCSSFMAEAIEPPVSATNPENGDRVNVAALHNQEMV